MEWFNSQMIFIALLWLLAALAFVAIVAVNPADREEDLWQDYLRDGFHAEPKQLTLDFEPTQIAGA